MTIRFKCRTYNWAGFTLIEFFGGHCQHSDTGSHALACGSRGSTPGPTCWPAMDSRVW